MTALVVNIANGFGKGPHKHCKLTDVMLYGQTPSEKRREQFESIKASAKRLGLTVPEDISEEDIEVDA